jgi:hypothetical protein
MYILEGLRRSIPARSADGRTLSRGTSVVILRRERGIAFVESLDPLEDLSDSAPRMLPSEEVEQSEVVDNR